MPRPLRVRISETGHRSGPDPRTAGATLDRTDAEAVIPCRFWFFFSSMLPDTSNSSLILFICFFAAQNGAKRCCITHMHVQAQDIFSRHVEASAVGELDILIK